jgi:hypothetical protein
MSHSVKIETVTIESHDQLRLEPYRKPGQHPQVWSSSHVPVRIPTPQRHHHLPNCHENAHSVQSIKTTQSDVLCLPHVAQRMLPRIDSYHLIAHTCLVGWQDILRSWHVHGWNEFEFDEGKLHASLMMANDSASVNVLSYFCGPL